MLDNQTYYFKIGAGEWKGTFSLQIYDWKTFWRSKIGFWNRLFVLVIISIQKLFGPLIISSKLEGFPKWGSVGVAINLVRLTKFGLTLYYLKEQNVLHPNGTDVHVHAVVRFGPFPLLLQSSKNYSRHIHKDGKQVTQLDIPLLGTVWSGDYCVLEDQRHIQGELVCKWASSKEKISCVISRQVSTESCDCELETINGVLERLKNYREWFDTVHDSRAIFTHAYLIMTKIFKERIPHTGFEDQDWVIALDIAFARQYFRALDACNLGQEVPAGWRPVFNFIKDQRTSVMEELILSMAAHIMYDLPLALESSGLVDNRGQSRVRDFHLANDVLQHAISRIQTETSRRYNPFLRWLDSVAGREDEILTNYGIRLARAAAWFNSERLSIPGNKEKTLDSLGRSVEIIAQQMIRPSLYSIRVLFRLGRLISRFTRVWPKAEISSETAISQENVSQKEM